MRTSWQSILVVAIFAAALGLGVFETRRVARLRARVRALVRRSAGKPSPVLKAGDLEIDTVARLIRRKGKPVELTPKEFALAEFMVLHRGELVTRTMIYDHLYDETDDTLSNVVDVYVSNLRRKLGKTFIETRRHQGYILGV